MQGQSRAARSSTWPGSMAPHPADKWWEAPPEQHWEVAGAGGTASAPYPWLLDMCDEVLLHILSYLDPFSLIRVSGVCSALYRVGNTDSLWAKCCTITFGCDFRTDSSEYTPKEAFKLLYMWKDLYRTLPYNRLLQDLLYSGFAPEKYWTRWLMLEKVVLLPPVCLPDHEIEDIWGITKHFLDKKHKVTDESVEETPNCVYKYEWKDLFNLALLHHGKYSNMLLFVMNKLGTECHGELEWLFGKYRSNRFQWLFSYWLFGLSRSFGNQLQKTYLKWQRFDKKRISNWGSSESDVQYLASLHYITIDFWNGKLAKGNENIGIQSVENYFSMCGSLLAWILGRKWGRFKQKKVYRDALDGVYHMLKHELQVSMVDHDTFWDVAKLQMTRICHLEKAAGNYVNWKLIDVLPSYRMFAATGDIFYLEQIKGILLRKQLINNWIFQEENGWVLPLLPQSLLSLLEYDTKLYEETLHGDAAEAQLSRLVWLYLHTGQQLYMDAMKGFVYEYAYASYASQIFECVSHAFVWM